MSRELVPVGDEFHLLDRASGETVALSEAGDDLLGEALEDLDERKRQVSEVRRIIGDECVRRMDREGEWTMTAGGVKITAPSPDAGKVEWDAELLHEILDQLVAEEVISRDAALRACSTRVEYVAHARGVAAVGKIPGVFERIQVAQREAEQRPRTVRVKR